MKAYFINKYTKEDLILADISTPSINENEVLVEIYAAGLNLLDSKIKTGEFKLILPYKLPLILGHDFAGVVVKIGKNVKNYKIGDEVYSRVSDFNIGTFAEYIAVNENDLASKPKNITMEEAASIPLVALTAWQALIDVANIKKGQRVFIQAGSGGVGTVAIQLAKYLGATVATTASTKSFDFLKELGADTLIDYKTQDFENLLKDYDVVLNSQDKKTLKKSLNTVKKGGKIISISGPPTPEFAKSIRASWLIKFVLTMISYRIRKKSKKKGIDYTFLFMKSNGEQLKEISKLIESGIIKPVVDKIFPFTETNNALKYVESGRAKGKVVVKMK